MAEQPHDENARAGLSRWVKVLLAILGVVALLALVMFLVVGVGGHQIPQHAPATPSLPLVSTV